NHLPRDDVGVVFERGDDDLIPRLEPWACIRLRDEIDCFCRPAREDNLFRRTGVDEPPHALTSAFEGFRRRLTECMNSAMYVGVRMRLVFLDGSQHCDWAL